MAERKTGAGRRAGLKRAGRTAGLLMFALVFAAGLSIQAFAARKLTEVSITVTNDCKVGGQVSSNDVEVTTRGDKYTVQDIEILNEIDSWSSTDTPVIEVTLDAEEGYYFSLVKSTINVRGGTYISGRKKEATSVILKIQLPSLRGQVGEIEEAHWSSRTAASWSGTYNVGYYEVLLYRDGKTTGDPQKVTDTSIDFAPVMTRPGTYTYRVRGVNSQDNSVKSSWTEGEGQTYIDEAAAAQTTPSNASGPAEAANQKSLQFGWIRDDKGWWYRNENDTYTANDWQLIDGKWYFFDSRGYMVTGWIEWNGKSYYCNQENGDMLVSAMVPDGSGRRVDSSGAWIQ